MPRFMPFVLSTLVALALLPVTAAAQPAGDHPNTTCAIDAVASHGGVAAKVDCLTLTPEEHGEFDGLVTVTLQADFGDGWEDVADDTCAGESREGVMVLPCPVVAAVTDADAPVRGLIDLDAPKSWDPAVADPTYVGGEIITEPLAADDCRVNESLETFDLTAPDGPWVDLCAVTMDAVVDAAAETVESLAVNVHVVGFLAERVPTGRWVTSLRATDCVHHLTVEDDTITGAVSAHLLTRCDRRAEECDDNPINTVLGLVFDCFRYAYGAEETAPLPPDAVDVSSGPTMVITIDPAELGPLAAADLSYGAEIRSVSAITTTGVRSEATGTVVFDADFAYSTGRTFTLS